jgi:hypothetical protein
MTTATLANGYTYSTLSVGTISPNSGTTDGGTPVSISGDGFNQYAIVYIGAAPLQDLVVVGSTEITGTIPAGTAGAVTVTVTQEEDSAALINGYTYIQAKSVTGISPAVGPIAGGTDVTIYGTGFSGSATATIGGAAVTSLSVDSEYVITGVAPSGSLGLANVVVSDTQTITLADGYTYQQNLAVTSISPAYAFTAGGVAVTISGVGFDANTTVEIDGVALDDLAILSSNTITGTVPAGSAGAQDVYVENLSYNNTLAGGFTYITPVQLTSISPTMGTYAGGTAVTVTGANFNSTALVTIGGNVLVSPTIVSSTSITGTTPEGVSGAQDIIVTQSTNAGADSDILLEAFTYSINPNADVGVVTIASTYSEILKLENGLQDTLNDVTTQNGAVTPLQMSNSEVKITQPLDAKIKHTW